MDCVLLAGGLGTRLSEETLLKPKPMVDIGGKPILWHIMMYYASFGVNRFIICCGYKGYIIKEYFLNYNIHNSDFTVDLSNAGSVMLHSAVTEDWEVTLVDTGEFTQTAGRLKKVQQFIRGDRFFATYGDGLSNVDLFKLEDFHLKSNNLATLTSVQPPGRFGSLNCLDGQVVNFTEKPQGEENSINGGFFVFEKEIFSLISGDDSVLELSLLPELSAVGKLGAFSHSGFWQPMDTLRDKTKLEAMWSSGNAPWKVW